MLLKKKTKPKQNTYFFSVYFYCHKIKIGRTPIFIEDERPSLVDGPVSGLEYYRDSVLWPGTNRIMLSFQYLSLPKQSQFLSDW
jgi:hypothetical protein